MSIPTYDPSNEPSAQPGGGQQQQYGQLGATQPPYAQPAYDPNAQQLHPAQQQPYGQQQQPYAQQQPPYGQQQQPYGQQQQQYPQGYGPPPQQASNGLGVAALVVGILAIFLFWFPLIGLVPGIAAAVLGIIGRSRAKSGAASNGGMALAGIIMGALSIVLNIGFFILAIKYGTASYSVGTPS